VYYLIGAGLGLACLLLFWKAPNRVLTQYGYLVFAIMLAIYVGAYLVTGDLPRIMIETAGASLALIAATIVRDRWPLGIGLFILAHGAYDHFFGAHSGVTEWYPPLCAGFDIIAGSGLIFLMLRQNKSKEAASS